MRRSAVICMCSRFCACAGTVTASALTRAMKVVVFLISVRCNHKMAPAVTGHRLVRLSRVEGELLAIADRAHPIRRNPERDEECLHGNRAPFSKRQVVLSRTSF